MPGWESTDAELLTISSETLDTVLLKVEEFHGDKMNHCPSVAEYSHMFKHRQFTVADRRINREPSVILAGC